MAQTGSIKSLTLANFRNYGSARLGCQTGIAVLSGPNGAGKTNLLEAISMFAPGRGLRRADLSSLALQSSRAPWGVAATLDDGMKLSTGLDPAAWAAGRERRVIQIEGENAKNQGELSRYIGVLWLTPQMDGIFLGPSSERRRFLDRMVQLFDPDHARRLSHYEKAMRQRSKLLKDHHAPHPSWLAGLEEIMATDGVAITAARHGVVVGLNDIGADIPDPFPCPQLRLAGTLEEMLETMSALEVEDRFKEMLAGSRPLDRETGGAKTGPHKSDLVVQLDGIPAADCSTGQQKGLLVSIILAAARLMRRDKMIAPVLLLDDVAAYLDKVRRSCLFEALSALGSQSWMSGTDADFFADLSGRCDHFRIEKGSITQSDIG